MSYDYKSYANQIQDRLDTGTTIGVRGLGKFAMAEITYASGRTSPDVSLQLYRNGKNYVSEETNIHLCNKMEGVPWSPLEVTVKTFKEGPESPFSPGWSTIKIGRDYIGGTRVRGEKARTRLNRSTMIFLPTDELVAIRDELTRAINETRNEQEDSSMTSAEALDLIERTVMCYNDQFDQNLPEEDREWNRIEYQELCDKLIALIRPCVTEPEEEV
tara:strand:+ start:157 stop:804 length:648 start_codon:yes stop_codon:yes gene_type:complete